MTKGFVKDVLQIDKTTIWLLIVFSIFISICSLIVPISVQAIVNTLAFSSIKRQFATLALILILVLGFAGILRAYQLLIVEAKEQELFARVSLGLADRLPRLKHTLLKGERDLQLVNLFLEIVSVQKVLMVIMIYLIEMSIQALTGFVLLALYHPYFLVLDCVVVIFIGLSLYLPYKKARIESFSESDNKHRVIEWLEEYLFCPSLFKFSNSHFYPLKKIDESLSNYLLSKQTLIKKIIHHFFGLYGTYVLANAGLLAVGGYLVFNAQLSLGQLVAAELVLNLILSSFLKLSYSLGTLYELMPACKKVSKIFDKSYETPIDIVTEEERQIFAKYLSSPPSIHFQHISFIDERNYQVFENINFSVPAGKSTAFYCLNRITKHGVIHLITGLSPIQEGRVLINEALLTEHRSLLLREKMMLVKEIEIFRGTIFDNLSLGNKTVEVEQLIELFDKFNLSPVINALPAQINSDLVACQKALSHLDLYKLMFIRAIIAKPLVLIIDSVFDLFTIDETITIKGILEDMDMPPTTIITTAREEVGDIFDHKVAL